MPKTKHSDSEIYQINLLSELPDTEPLADYIVRPTDLRWGQCLKDFKECPYFGFDIETWGALPEWGLDPWRGSIRLIQSALPNGSVLVLNLGGREGCPGDALNHIENFLAILKIKLECKKTKVIGHNLKFDCLWMAVKYGFETRCARDTMLLSRIYWAGIRQYRHSLKALAERLEIGEVDKTEQTSDFSWKLRNAQINYAAKDALLVIQIFKKIGKMIQEADMSGVALSECAALPAWVQIEERGMPVCKETLDKTLAAYLAVEKEVIAPWYDVFPNVNPASQKQVLEAVKETYGITLDKTDQAALIHYTDKPALSALLDWRTLLTFINYLKALQERYMGGAVRSSYNQLGPMGTRSNSANPNLQNPPRHGSIPDSLKHHNLPPLRGVFKVPEGYNLLIADLSQAHARLATAISRDKTLVDIYNTGADMHCITAAGMAKVQKLGNQWTAKAIGQWRKGKNIPESMDIAKTTQQAALLRQVAKPLFYGSLNGAGGLTIQRTAKTDAGIDMDIDEAKAAVLAWRETYKGLYTFQKRQAKEANKTDLKVGAHSFGAIRGLSNRRIYLKKWPSDYREGEAVKPSDACACTWAGDEKTVMALAMSEEGFLGEIDNHPEWEAWIANNCHDELDVVVKSEYALEAAAILQTKMQAAMKTFIGDLIPVDEAGAKPEDLIAISWADK